jgi:hypothetical protein
MALKPVEIFSNLKKTVKTKTIHYLCFIPMLLLRIIPPNKPFNSSFSLYNRNLHFYSQRSLLSVSECEEEEIILPVRYYPESLSALSSATSFSEHEIKKMYRSFKASCPTGFIREDTFKDIYSQFFPFGGESQILQLLPHCAKQLFLLFNKRDNDSENNANKALKFMCVNSLPE